MKQAQMSEWEGDPGRVCIARVPLVTRLGKNSAAYKPSRVSWNLAWIYPGLWTQWQGGGRQKLQRG